MKILLWFSVFLSVMLYTNIIKAVDRNDCFVGNTQMFGEICNSLATFYKSNKVIREIDFTVHFLSEQYYTCRHINLFKNRRKILFQSQSPISQKVFLSQLRDEIKLEKNLPISVLDEDNILITIELGDMVEEDSIIVLPFGGNIYQIKLNTFNGVLRHDFSFFARLSDLCEPMDKTVLFTKSLNKFYDIFLDPTPKIHSVGVLKHQKIVDLLENRRYVYRNRHSDIN